MSDQLFIGTAPESPAGEEIRFHSHEDWLALATFILNNLTDEFPLYPTLDKDSALVLATDLEELLESGICKDFHERYAIDSSASKTKQEAQERVNHRLALTRKFIDFLQACGGCSPA